MILGDGTVVQDGMKFKMRGADPHFVPYPVVGIIRNVYHLDSEDNGDGISVMCDIHVPSFGIDLFKVPFLQEKSSADNFIDYRPQAVSKRVAAKGTPPPPSNDLILDPTKDNGDAVLVMFVNGSIQFPVIIKTLPSYHSRAEADVMPYPRLGEADGDHYRIRMNGLEIMIDKDGNLDIKSTKTAETVPPNKKITVTLGVEEDPPDVMAAQKQSIELVIDNAEDAPKVSITVTENTMDQKKQVVEIDGTAQSMKLTNQHSGGENSVLMDPNGVTINIKGDATLNVDGNTLTDVTGDLTATVTGKTNITAKDDVTISAEKKVDVTCGGDTTLDVTGKLTATVSGDAMIDSGGTATVKGATKAIVEAPAIELGDGATESVVKGTAFKTWLTAHTHPTAVGPSGPPVQAATFDIPPGTHLSTIVKTK
jgi:hypothetical protein